MNKILTQALVISSLLFCGLSHAKDIVVEDVYVRAVPPGQPTSAAYMILKNSSAQDQILVAADSSVAEVAELHTHLHEDGMMKMRKIDKIEIPAGSSAKLRPSGMHIMLIRLKRQLAPGEEVDLILEFADGSQQTVIAPVKKISLEMLMQDMQETGSVKSH